MEISRRDFFKYSGATLAALMAADLGFDTVPVQARADELKIKFAKATPSICPYCSVGCGILVHTRDGKVINTEGDSDHPINHGSLCSKGAAVFEVANNPRRLTRPLYRAPGGDRWEEKDWDWVLDRIATNVKKTRDAGFIKSEKGMPVNRAENIACLGGAALDNEECYLLYKEMRSLGIVYLEHQARV